MKRLMAVMLALGLGAAPASAQNASGLVAAQNQFALDLYGKLRTTPENLFFSPYSVSAALGMTYLGARGETAAQMAAVLHLSAFAPGLGGEALQAAYAKAIAGQILPVGKEDGDFTFRAANALWLQLNYKVRQDFLSAVAADFGGAAKRVDFMHPEFASAQINAWVAKETADKIPNLVSPLDITEQTRLILTNAVYFKAEWARAFKAQATDKQVFHVTPTADVQADMMHMRDEFALTQADGVKVLSLPYGARNEASKVSMVVILPDGPDKLAAVEAGLTAKTLDGWLAASVPTDVVLALPRFQSTTSFDLSGMLQALGMKAPFSGEHADFDGIAKATPDERLYIGKVIHKAFVKTAEAGTEAAAATAVVMVATASMAPGPPPPPPVMFIADHPFLYLIRDETTGLILFMGRVSDPTQTD